jgi:hypothetical protein
MPIDTSMYRTAAPANPFETITQVGHAAGALGDLMVGRAMQQAIDPATGEVDQNRLLGMLRQSPVGAARAVPAMQALQQLKAAGYAADQAGLETFQKRMAITHHLFSGLASKKDPTMSDVYDIAATALDPALNASKYGITLPVIMNAVKQFQGLTPEQIKKKALEIQTMAAHTSEILHQHSPGWQMVNQGGQLTMVPTGTPAAPAIGTAIPTTLPPTTVIATPEGGRYLGPQPAVPGGGVVGPGGEPIVPATPMAPPGTRTTGQTGPATGPAATLPPGYAEAAGGIAGESARAANDLMRSNDSSMTRKAMIGNLEEDLRHFTSGPAADWTLVAKAWANRNLPIPESWKERGGVFDAGSIASQEQFNKQAGMLAHQQFQTIGGTGTDAKFNSAFTTNPGQTLTQLGNVGIMRLLKGNEDAIQAKAKEWNKWLREGHGPQTYGTFSQQFNEHFDPRVFQFKYLPASERQEYVDNMTPGERRQFLVDMTYARKKGWVSFPAPKAAK